jgi:L-threonylcarbamoyladenylate synthase
MSITLSEPTVLTPSALSDELTAEFVKAFAQGEVLAYPTEAVFGLGCDPDNQSAVEKVLAMKTRPQDKGLILIAATIEQLYPYIDISSLDKSILDNVNATWPGPFTWIMPKAAQTPDYLTGGRETIAVRVSAHPTVIQLCQAVNKPLVSTSANPSGAEPARNIAQLNAHFGRTVFAIDGEVDHNAHPSKIQDAVTGQVLRG